MISADLCIPLSAIYHVLIRRLSCVKSRRTVCYTVQQTLFWFLVRLPSVCFSTVRLVWLFCWACPHWATVVAQWISLHCVVALVTTGQMPFMISSLSKLMSILYFDLLWSSLDVCKSMWDCLYGAPLQYPYLLSERAVTAVLPYRHELLDFDDFLHSSHD